MEEDIEFCCGFKSKIQPFWNICWKYISPMFLAVIIVFSVVDLFAKDMKGSLMSPRAKAKNAFS